jgi:hypothetical protein
MLLAVHCLSNGSAAAAAVLLLLRILSGCHSLPLPLLPAWHSYC